MNFAAWRKNIEEPAVMAHLVKRGFDSEEGMLPKEILAQRVIEHDREVTAAYARTETLQADVGQLRATFSDRFPIR